ncbi:MAG: sugar phosphate isomerase/epimerase family protein [Pontiella sp.]
MKNPIGICSWSLHNNPFEVFHTLEQTGLTHLHLGLVAANLFQEAIAENNWTVSATMLAFPQENYSSLDSIRETGGIVPDDCWALNRELVLDAIEKTAGMGVEFLSFHAGFIDHTDDERYQEFCGRMRKLADSALAADIVLLLETGQETAEDLRAFLENLNHPALGVNFDPANMILYDKGDPIKAVRTLAPWIKHVHIKDAVKTPVSGQWGTEVPWGDGEVGCDKFIKTLDEIGYQGAMAVEREAGEKRAEDIKLAADRLGEVYG